jgi:hypothetical protein
VGIGKKVTGATSAAFLLATSVVTLGFVSQATPAAALPLGVSVTTATGYPSDPSDNPAGTTTVNIGSGVVPNGMCRARVRVRSGSGQSPTDAGLAGRGVDITATFTVTPGQTAVVQRHSGGRSQTAENDGGRGGDAAEVLFGGTTAIVAGGGGGAGNNSDSSPYPTNMGGGGDGGLPTGSGTTNGTGGYSGNESAGPPSTTGGSRDGDNGAGGNGGTGAAGGGGLPANNGGGSGSAGSGRFGGLGGAGDNDFIVPGGGGSGGSGGAGFSGGGGGGGGNDAIPDGNNDSGGGGGGGSSHIAAANLVTTVINEYSGSVNHAISAFYATGRPSSGTDSDTTTSGFQIGTEVTYYPCVYDLGTTKTTAATLLTRPPGGPDSTYTYTLNVTNSGPDRMATNTAAVGAGVPSDRDTVIISDPNIAGAFNNGAVVLTLPSNCRSVGATNTFPVVCADVVAELPDDGSTRPNGTDAAAIGSAPLSGMPQPAVRAAPVMTTTIHRFTVSSFHRLTAGCPWSGARR